MTFKKENHNPEEILKAVRAMQIRMRTNALHHIERIGPRTIRALQHLDLFEEEVSIGENVDLTVLNDPQHTRRQRLSDGPLVLYVTEEDKLNGVIVELPVLLFSENRDVRLTALESIEKMLRKDSMAVTPKTSTILKESRDALMSDMPKDWRPTAVVIYDALCDDVLISLRGTKQCLETIPLIQDQLNFYTPKVMHPSVSSLDSISLPIGHPEKNHAHLARVLSEIVTNATSLTQLCSSYLDKLGFLPLAPQYSLSAAIENWHTSNLEVDVWTQVWDWANKERTPISRYHACSVFVRQPQLIPGDKLSEFWSEVLTVVSDSTNKGEDGLEREPWTLRRELTKHYIYHLEALMPESDGGSIACFAWWFAEQVANLFPADSDSAKFYRKNWVKPASDLSSRIWLIANSPIQGSFLRYITLIVPSPWALALLALMSDEFERLALTEQEVETQTRFHEAVVSNAISSLPFPLEPSVDATFAFEFPLTDLILKYAENQEDKNQKDLEQLVSTCRTLGVNSDLFDALRKLNEFDLPNQVIICFALKAKAYTDPTVAGGVWEIVSDEEWRRTVLSRIDIQILAHLIESLSVLLVNNRDKWFWLLPHYIADLCENEENEERRYALFLYVIHTSLASDTVSAVCRLLRGVQKAKFVEHVKEYRALIESMSDHYPPWVAGKVRGLMASLHVV